MKLETLMIGFLLFSAAVLGLSSLYTETVSVYSPSGNSTSQDTFDKFNQSFATINSQLDDVQQKSTDVSNKPASLYNQVQQSILVFIDLAGVLVTMSTIPNIFITETFAILPFEIPAWFSTTVMTIIALIFVYKVAAIVLRQTDI